MGDLVTEEALEEKIDEEVDKASFSSLALACYILVHDENTNTFEEFDTNSIDKFDNWAQNVIENEIYNVLHLLILMTMNTIQKKN